VGAIPLPLSSLTFGFLHTQMLAGTLAGLAYAYAAWRRGKLADAVAAQVLYFGDWPLWS